jgi:hypothetical protein
LPALADNDVATVVNDDDRMNAVVNNNDMPAGMNDDNRCVGGGGSDSAEGDRCAEDEG